MGKDVIIACDFSSKEETLAFLDRFHDGEKPFVKIGMELYYAEGPEIIREIKNRGHKIFLDLKLHDIPNTVKKAMKVLSKLDVDICNVHAGGTIEMMQAALDGLIEGSAEKSELIGEAQNLGIGDSELLPRGKCFVRPLLIAVTQLTSTTTERMKRDLMINGDMDEVVMHYAMNAKKAGLDGVVCSPLESGIVHSNCGREFLTVTPGVRFADDDKGDQKRVTTPSKAKELGSDYIVVGRSITGATDPVAAYRRCLDEFVG